MPNDVNTMTPGSAVADQLQQILTSKRAEARQNLIDSLSLQSSQSQDEVARENAASNREERQAHAAERLANAAKDQAGIQDRANREAKFNELMKDPEFAKLDPLHQWAAIDATGHNAPSTLWQQNDDAPMSIFDEATGKLSPAMLNGKPMMGKKGERPITRSRAPQGPQTPTPTLTWSGNDKDNLPLYLSNRMDKDGKPVVMYADGKPYTGGPITKPTTGVVKAPTKFPGTTLQNLAKFRKAATGGSIIAASDGDTRAWDQARNIAISQYPTTSDVRDTVRDALDPDRQDQSVPIKDIVKTHEGKLTPQELEDFRDLLENLR